jgi:hypothetical protein
LPPLLEPVEVKTIYITPPTGDWKSKTYLLPPLLETVEVKNISITSPTGKVKNIYYLPY